MRCIEFNYPHSHHHHPHHDHHRCNYSHKNDTIRTYPYASGRLEHRKRRGNGAVVLLVPQVMPVNVELFSGDLVVIDAVARRPDTQVLLQTGGLMLVAYLITNFVVPQFVAKSLGLNQPDDENQKPDDEPEPVDNVEPKARSRSANRGFNSTKPK